MKSGRLSASGSTHRGEVALSFALRYAAYVSQLVLVGPAATGFPYSEFLMLLRTESQSNKVEDLIAASTRSPYLLAPGHDAARNRLHNLTCGLSTRPYARRYAIAGKADLSICAGTSDAHFDSNRV